VLKRLREEYVAARKLGDALRAERIAYVGRSIAALVEEEANDNLMLQQQAAAHQASQEESA
jgi:hypothetical protein